MGVEQVYINRSLFKWIYVRHSAVEQIKNRNFQFIRRENQQEQNDRIRVPKLRLSSKINLRDLKIKIKNLFYEKYVKFDTLTISLFKKNRKKAILKKSG